MARLFDVVRELSGQAAAISIPRPYIRFCDGNHNHAAVLSQLVFWSSTKPDGEWFYKANDELASELEMSVDQVRYAVRQLKTRLDGVIQSRVRKANGVPTTHYQIDGNKLVELLFPRIEQDYQIDMGKLPEQESKHNSQMDSVNLPDGNGGITNSTCENSHIQGSGNITDSINRSLPDTNKQISVAPSKLEPEEPALFEIPLSRKGQYLGVTQLDIQEYSEAYPAVDIRLHLKRMILWCKNNPQKRKATQKGARRFIQNWLAKEQDKGRNLPPEQQPQQAKSDGDEIKSKVRQLEMDIDNENQHLLRVMNYGGSEQAIQASKNKIKRLSDERRELLDQLAEVDSDGGEVSWRDGFAA